MEAPWAAPAPAEIVITPEVVAAVGAHAAAATPGVIRLEAGLGDLVTGLGRAVRQRIAGISPAPVTGTSATVTGRLTRLRVSVAVSADWPAAATAAAVQRSVAQAVADATGLSVAGVSVAILDVVPPGRPAGDRQLAQPSRAAGADAGGAASPVPGPDEPGSSRARVGAAVLRAVRSVPGLRPASPVLPERVRWMHWDPALLAVGLDSGHLEVQLAATRLPLPARLDQAAAAIRAATAETPWATRPHRLVVSALDAGALQAEALTEARSSPTGRDE